VCWLIWTHVIVIVNDNNFLFVIFGTRMKILVIRCLISFLCLFILLSFLISLLVGLIQLIDSISNERVLIFILWC